jgi:hypothetical protein
MRISVLLWVGDSLVVGAAADSWSRGVRVRDWVVEEPWWLVAVLATFLIIGQLVVGVRDIRHGSCRGVKMKGMRPW